MPNFIVCQDVNAQLELITNGHTKNHKCYFRAFDLIPRMHYDILRESVDKRMKIGENPPPTENFIQFAHEGVMYFIWIDSNDITENVEWWVDEWNTDAVALRLACQHSPNDTFYCVGFDYYHGQTSSGIYIGSHIDYVDNSSRLKRHNEIEEEFPNSKFIFIGKDMDYGEFENLLNK